MSSSSIYYIAGCSPRLNQPARPKISCCAASVPPPPAAPFDASQRCLFDKTLYVKTRWVPSPPSPASPGLCAAAAAGCCCSHLKSLSRLLSPSACLTPVLHYTGYRGTRRTISLIFFLMYLFCSACLLRHLLFFVRISPRFSISGWCA